MRLRRTGSRPGAAVAQSSPGRPCAGGLDGPHGEEAAAKEHRPNIVLVLMDDFSLELLATMPEARRMQAAGATYRNSHVIDSLCCPSRASIFTGGRRTRPAS